LASGDEVAGLNDSFRFGLETGLLDGRRGDESVFRGVMITEGFGRFEESYVMGAKETLRGTSVTKGDLSPVVMAMAGLNVVDLSLMSMISTDGLAEISSGNGESLESRDEFRLRRLLRFGVKFLPISGGVVNSAMN
jgi:hypothetical protein